MTAANPWEHVSVHASATMATLLGIGWKPISAKVWITDLGNQVDLATTIPYMVKEMTTGAVERIK